MKEIIIVVFRIAIEMATQSTIKSIVGFLVKKYNIRKKIYKIKKYIKNAYKTKKKYKR